VAASNAREALVNVGCSSTKYTRVLIGGALVAATRYYDSWVTPRVWLLETRSQDPYMDGSGLRSKPPERGGISRHEMPLTIRIADRNGRSCV